MQQVLTGAMDGIIQLRCGKSCLLQADDHCHEVAADLRIGYTQAELDRRIKS